jgi:hypothetical protein
VEAQVQKIRAISVYGLLGIQLANNTISADDANEIVKEIHAAARGPKGVSLVVSDLTTEGHIRIPQLPG